MNSQILAEMTVKVFERAGGGKKMLFKTVEVGSIFSFRELLVGRKVCGEAESLELRYNK